LTSRRPVVSSTGALSRHDAGAQRPPPAGGRRRDPHHPRRRRHGPRARPRRRAGRRM